MANLSSVTGGQLGLGSDDAPARGSAQRRRAIAAAAVGNILEWYDFSVYGYVAIILAAKFLPPGDEVAALLSTFAIFGVGFVARPLGGLVIGRYADVKGRKPALMLTILLMAAGTALIGIIPTYASIGILAAVLLVVARLMQGFSAGGEYGAVMAFLVESAPAGKRGFYGSLQQCTIMLGLLLGSGMAALFSTVLSAEAMDAWGWRVLFLLGALIGPVGFYMRRTVAETPAFERRKAQPTAESAFQWGPAARLFALVATPFAVAYTFLTYLPTFTQKYAGLTRTEALWSNTIALIVLVITIPIAGAISDRVGRRPFMIGAGVAFLVLSYPLLNATLAYPGFATVVAVQIVFALLYTIYSGAGAAAYVELFPTRNRLFWLSSSYNASGILFGAFAPYIATWLIQQTGSPVSVAWLVVVAAALSCLGLIGMRETAHSPLR